MLSHPFHVKPHPAAPRPAHEVILAARRRARLDALLPDAGTPQGDGGDPGRRGHRRKPLPVSGALVGGGFEGRTTIEFAPPAA